MKPMSQIPFIPGVLEMIVYRVNTQTDQEQFLAALPSYESATGLRDLYSRLDEESSWEYKVKRIPTGYF